MEADDYDYGFSYCISALQQWFNVEHSGRLYVSARIRIPYRGNKVSGGIGDECGWSEVDVSQIISLFTQITYPYSSPRYFASSYYPVIIHRHDTDESDHSWEESAGNTWAEYDIVFPGIQIGNAGWVIVNIGSYAENNFWSNDCYVRTHINSYLDVRKLGIVVE